MIVRKYRQFVCDFETTVYEGQESTEVWASATVEIGTEDVMIFHSIADQYNFFKDLHCNVVAYYHNLKFDGAFWLSFLIEELNMNQALQPLDEKGIYFEWIDTKEMKNNTFKYSISDMGQWYSIVIKVNNCIIEFRDSLKLLPFAVKVIGENFKTKHQKLDMEYTGYRYAGCTITDEEKKYISNDVLVVKEALEIMFEEGHKSLTIGACCLQEYKKIIGKFDFSNWYPDLTQIALDKETYGSSNVDEYIRHSYKGGWCYLVRGKENQLKYNGTTADVNSLYPSMMSGESGNNYPVGKPKFWSGDFIPEEALNKNKYYFVRLRTRFYLKPNMLPFIQIKGNPLYKGTECLESSDVLAKDGNHYPYYMKDGKIVPAFVELTLTQTDFELMKEHYELVDCEILDGCYFFNLGGDMLFDLYINKYKKIKMENKGAKRELAKLFLNNLYGKMASNNNSSFKVAYLKDDKSIGFRPVSEHNKGVVYIPVGSAITSYARNFTIRAAQKNYYGREERGFIYADTDSIHCDLAPEEIQGIKVDDTNFCCWKLEASWDVGIFSRQKTYIEHVVAENLKPIEEPYYNVKCAGMPKKCKQLFVKSLDPETKEKVQEDDNYTEDEKEFLSTTRTLNDFKLGLKVPGKLLPKRIKGGIILVDTSYEMR